MTGDDFREAVKWSLIAAAIVALWVGVLAVRKARSAVPYGSVPLTSTEETDQLENDFSSDMRLVWVIVVYETREKELVGITEFVFASYQDCLSGAAEARKKLGLQLMPGCFVRWIKQEPGEGF